MYAHICIEVVDISQVCLSFVFDCLSSGKRRTITTAQSVSLAESAVTPQYDGRWHQRKHKTDSNYVWRQQKYKIVQGFIFFNVVNLLFINKKIFMWL